MRRKLAFIGFILGTCFASILSIVLFVEWIATIELINQATSVGYSVEGAAAAFVLITFIGLFMITSLILNAVSISATTNATKMTNKKGLVITSVVFNFINIALLLSVIVSSIDLGMITAVIFYIIFMLGLIATNILVLVDLGHLKNAFVLEQTAKVKKDEQSKVEQPKTEQSNIQPQIEPQAQTPVNSKIDALEEEINKLIILKAKNLITKEEFEQLKKRAIEKSLNL